MDAADIGSSLEVLPAQISGESLSIAFNVRYLKEAIKAIAASELKMQLNSNTSAAVLSPEVLSQNVRAASMLLMPVQMRDEVPAPPRGKTKNSSHKQEERELAPA
jgi:DNA polymerase-3 subunit beta